MTDGYFEGALRSGLATLAREAVPEVEVPLRVDVVDMHPVQPRADHAGRRVVALAVAIALGVGAVAIAVSMHGERRSTRIVGPQPIISAVPIGPLGPRADQAAVFTGTEVLIWGGHYQPVSETTPPVASASTPGTTSALADGAAFDLETERWRKLAPAPIVARYNAVAAWTGSEMLVVGGLSDAVPATASRVLETGAAYDPARDRWRQIPDAPLCVDTGAWTGKVLVVGGNCAGAPFGLAAFDPRRNSWTRIPTPPNFEYRLVGLDGALFAWNGQTLRGAKFEPSSRSWLALPPLPEQPSGFSAVATFGKSLAVMGPVSPVASGTAVDLLVPGASAWQHLTSSEVGSLGPAIAGSQTLLVWNEGVGYAWMTGDPTNGSIQFAHVASGPASLDRVSETLLIVGDRRVFIWGGQSIPNGASGTSRPSNDGALIEIP